MTYFNLGNVSSTLISARVSSLLPNCAYAALPFRSDTNCAQTKHEVCLTQGTHTHTVGHSHPGAHLIHCWDAPRWQRRPVGQRSRCQKSLKLNICQLQTASRNAQKSNTKFAIIQNWGWRRKWWREGGKEKKRQKAVTRFSSFLIWNIYFFFCQACRICRTLRCEEDCGLVCGLRFAICLIYFLNWHGRISICECRVPHAACLMPQPVSYSSSARHDKVSVCPSVSAEKKGKFTQFDIEIFPWPEMITAQVSFDYTSSSNPQRVPRVVSSLLGCSTVRGDF